MHGTSGKRFISVEQYQASRGRVIFPRYLKESSTGYVAGQGRGTLGRDRSRSVEGVVEGSKRQAGGEGKEWRGGSKNRRRRGRRRQVGGVGASGCTGEEGGSGRQEQDKGG